MTNKGALKRLLQYTVWANHRIVRAAVTLSPEDFRKDMGASHGGVRGTLTHMMNAEWYWLERFKGVEPAGAIDEGQFQDLIGLRERWGLIEEHRDAWFEGLPEDAVAQRIRHRGRDDVELEVPLWQLIQHVANHSSYHRGQVVTLLRVLGIAPVATDMVLWDREQAAARDRDEERKRAQREARSRQDGAGSQ